MKNYSPNPLENTIINILQEGHIEVWKSLDLIKNPIERCNARKTFAQALQKIQKENS